MTTTKRGRPKRLGDDTVAVGLKVPQALNAALLHAAATEFESPAAYVRRALIEQLRRDGYLAPPSPAPLE